MSLKQRNIVKAKEEVLKKSSIRVGLDSVSKYDAIKMAGKILVDNGYVEDQYIEAMIKREDSLTTYIGYGVAIPHGIGEARQYIKNSGLVILQYPNGIDFDGETAYLVIGIAGIGDEHMEILANVATIIGEGDENKLIKIFTTKDIEYLYDVFTEEQ